jgi:hypothetical protein
VSYNVAVMIFGSAVALFTLLPLRDRYSEALR